MPQGFNNIRHPSLTTNSFGQDQNCYFCTVAALLNMTTSELVGRAETMMQDTAQPAEIIALMRNAGINNPSYTTYHSQAVLEADLASLPAGRAVGLAYGRVNGTGHMIVACRDEFGRFGLIDYQASPPTVTTAFPENVATIAAMFLFFHS